MRRPAPAGALSLLLLSALGAAAAPAGRPSSAADPALGRRIYRDGVLPSGLPLVAELPSGVRLQGAAAACASCHRRSGFGGAEGTVLIPPVTGPALFAGAGRDRASLFKALFHEELDPAVLARLHGLGDRPPYSDETLAAALAAGRDPAGRPLDPLMPRYPLSAAEVGHLVAYLRTLAAAPDPGIEERTLHVATVVTPGADPDRWQRVHEVQEAYLHWHNAEVERRLARPVPPASEEEALSGGWRRWNLQVWELRGPQSSWAGQLARFQRARPVFALLGGLDGGAGWEPVHAFCEAQEIPCLFPATDRPPADDGATSLYLSGGLPAEAVALAEALWARAAEGAGGTVVQVYRDDPRGRDVARRLRAAFAGSLSEPGVATADPRSLALLDRPLAAGRAPDWPSLLAGRPSALVLWLPPSDLVGLPAAGETAPAVYLSSAFLAGALSADGLPTLALAAGQAGRTTVLWRFARPGAVFPQAFRLRGWLRARGVGLRAGPDERLQLDTYTAFALADAAIAHLGGALTRELFVEAVEREAERLPNPGVYPRLSLGPGQRVAAKACAVVPWLELAGTR